MEANVSSGQKAAARVLTSLAALCLIAVGATTAGAQGQSGTGISATVTAAGSFARTNTYAWTLSESVTPSSAQITSGGTQVFTHTLQACRTLINQMDTPTMLQGQVCVTNSGSAPTTNLQIVVQVQDQVISAGYQNLSGAVQTITPAAQLPAGGSQCYGYSIPITPVSGAAYRVVATVTVTNHSGTQVSGPSPKTAGFSLTPSTVTNIDGTASVTDFLGSINCGSSNSGGFPISGGLTPSTWTIQGSDLVNDCATKTFTITVTDNSTNGGQCSLTDMATMTLGTSGTTIPAQSTVTFCDLRMHLSSCLDGEAVLQAFIYPGGTLNGNGLAASYLTQLLDLINGVRASMSTSKKPVPPLTRLVVLDSAAQGYSQTLVNAGALNLSHTLDGDPTSREQHAGYNPTTVGENLAAGQFSPQEVINAWVNSPANYANLINPSFTQVGLGLSGGPASDGETFVLDWVADFGSSTQQGLTVTPSAPPVSIDVRGVVAQLNSYLQMADAAACAGDAGALATSMGVGQPVSSGQGFVNYWLSQNLENSSPPLTTNIRSCLQAVLGYYSSVSSADYTSTTNYITNTLIPGG